MSVDFVDTENTGGDDTSVTIAVPGLAVAGNLLLSVVGSHDWNNTEGQPVVPSGWTTLNNGWTDHGTVGVRVAFAYRIMQLGDTNWTWSHIAGGFNIAGSIIAYSGVDEADPINASILSTSPASSFNPFETVSVTSTVPNCRIVRISGFHGNLTSLINALAGTTERVDELAPSLVTGWGPWLAEDDTILADPGASGTADFTMINPPSSGAYRVMTLALAPAALGALSLTKHLFRRRRTF